MARMNTVDRVIEPASGAVREFHQRKHRVFMRMHDDQLAYRALVMG